MKGLIDERKRNFKNNDIERYFTMNKKNNTVERGDIFYYDFGETKGSIQSGIRPVLILQCNQGNEASPTTIVASITSAIKKRYLPSHIYLGQDFGLRDESMVLLEQISTINQCDLERYVGHIDDEHLMRVINNALKKELGMWNYAPRKNEEIRCLCGKCVDSYRYGADYIVKRQNPYDKIKGACDICGRPGYDYLISERNYSCNPSKVSGNG